MYSGMTTSCVRVERCYSRLSLGRKTDGSGAAPSPFDTHGSDFHPSAAPARRVL